MAVKPDDAVICWYGAVLGANTFFQCFVGLRGGTVSLIFPKKCEGRCGLSLGRGGLCKRITVIFCENHPLVFSL